MQSQTEQSCYNCKYRQDVAGSCHSTCTSPYADTKAPVYFMLQQAKSLQTSDDSFIIEGDEHGIRNGWFMWPIDFDPVWVEKCTGFERK
jgi:hypothetical protein